jgi:hypothetical protein
MIFGKKRKSAGISVELKIVGFMSGEYVSIIEQVPVTDGCSLPGLLKKARSAGLVPGALYHSLVSLPAGISVLINGEPVSPQARGTALLHNGDSISFFSASAGG